MRGQIVWDEEDEERGKDRRIEQKRGKKRERKGGIEEYSIRYNKI